MKSTIRFGVAAALGLASLQAMAIAPPASNDNVLLVGGATATDRTLFESLLDATDGICENNAYDGDNDPLNDNTATVYFVGGASTTSPANFLVRCRGKTGVAGIAGQTIAIGKFSGGSETGVINVAQKSPTAIAGNPITYPNQASLSCSHQGGGGAGTTGLISYQFYINCGAITPDGTNGYDISNPRFGISDVEPKLFGLSAAGTQSVESAVDVTFAPVVSRNFYKALQDAQGLTGTRTVQRNATTTAVVTCTDLATTDEACLPTLSSAQVRGLLSQKIQATDLRAAGVVLAGAAGNVRICRRGDTSGTQKSFENYFFGQGCLKNAVVTFAKDTNVIDTTVTPNRQCSTIGCAFSDANIGTTGIFQGTGSGDVESCLDDAVADSVYAIGTLSTDRIPNDSNKEFRFIKLDGVSPILQNVVDGRYNFFSENTVITATGLTPVQTSTVTAIKARFRTPTLLDSTLVNNGINTNGVVKVNAGLLVRPTALTPPGAPSAITPQVDYVTRPVATQVKGVNLGGTAPTVDNCIPPAFVQGTDSPVSPSSITAP